MVEIERKCDIHVNEATNEFAITSCFGDEEDKEEIISSPIKEVFRDGKRRIDYILAYQQENKKNWIQETVDIEEMLDKDISMSEIIESEEIFDAKEVESENPEYGVVSFQKDMRREYFLTELQEKGLELEEESQEVIRIGDEKFKRLFRMRRNEKNEKETVTLNFIKIHVPFEILCQYAEKLNYAMPYDDTGEFDDFTHNQFKQSLNKTFIEQLGLTFLIPTVPPHLKPCKYRTKVFEDKIRYKYYGIENEETFFSTGQRSAIAEHILQITPYGPDSYGLKSGIGKLLKKKLLTDAYPLHEGNEKQEKQDEDKPLTERQFLKLYWASFKPRAFFSTQPIPQIRHYLGEKIAIYFAWLGFYTKWLHMSTIIGLLIFLIGPYTIRSNTIAAEACHTSGATLVYCPKCRFRCDFESSEDFCFLIKISNLLDNEGTVFYAAFMSFWAVLFLEFWKRYQFYLQYDWDLLDYEPLQENPRAEFVIAMRNRYKNASEKIKKKIWKVNPITGKSEFFQEPSQVKVKLLAGLSVTLTVILVVLAILIGIIFYRAGIAPLIEIALVTNSSFQKGEQIREILGVASALLISLTAGILQLIFIFIMNSIYKQLAIVLTKWELNRTQTEHDNSFTTKMSLFQLVNFYASPMYIAFIKGRAFVGYPGRTEFFPGIDGLESCAQYGCLLELTFQLVVIFAMKQTLNNVKELVTPLLKVGIKRCISLFRKKNKDEYDESQTPWQRDQKLVPEGEFGLFEEYLELVIQFGFVTIFAAAFPLAPLLALINNYFEIRLDAVKYLRLSRRIVPERVQDIGPWYTLLDAIAKFSVISNALLISFLGSTVNLWIYKATFPGKIDYLNTTLASIPIRNFVNTDRFPDYRSRSHRILVNGSFVDFDQHILIPVTYYCVEVNSTCDNTIFVNPNNNLTAENCCQFLNMSNTVQRKSECILTNGSRTCCLNENSRSNHKFLPTQTATSSSCCSSVIAEFINANNTLPNTTLYYREEGNAEDPSNPRYGGEFFSGCEVNFVRESAVCRFYSGYELSENMNQDQREFYFKSNLFQLLFAIIFEHLVFLIVAIVANVVPDIPQSIQNHIKRGKYINKFGSRSKVVRKARPSIFESRSKARK